MGAALCSCNHHHHHHHHVHVAAQMHTPPLAPAAHDPPRRFSTYQGIDTCGQRLADEIRAVVASAPALTRISVVAHSMGGLMARYAVGALFNPHKSLVCGLEPCHFVSMATPHCGCDADGVAQVCGLPRRFGPTTVPLSTVLVCRYSQPLCVSTASLITTSCPPPSHSHKVLQGAATTTTPAPRPLVVQVPFIDWTGDIPLLGQQLYRFLQSISGSTVSPILKLHLLLLPSHAL